MSNFKKNRLFIILFALVGIGLGVNCILIVLNVLHVARMKDNLKNLKSQLQSLMSSSPSPIKKNVAVTAENLQQIHKLRNQWDKFFGEVQYSKTPLECYLNLQTEIETIKDRAKAANVLINPKCCFGFSQYLNAEKFPDTQNLRELDRQCQIISILGTILIESRPLEVISFGGESLNDEVTEEDGVLNKYVVSHLHTHNIFYSKLFKLSFTGTTQTLRLFINKIQHMQIPIFIRDIEVTQQSQGRGLLSVEDVPVFSIAVEIVDFKTETT